MVWWAALLDSLGVDAAGGTVGTGATSLAAEDVGAGAIGSGATEVAGLSGKLGNYLGEAAAPYGKFASTVGRTIGEGLGQTKLGAAYDMFQGASNFYDKAFGDSPEVLGGTSNDKNKLGSYKNKPLQDSQNLSNQLGDSLSGAGGGGQINPQNESGKGILSRGILSGLLSGGGTTSAPDMSKSSVRTGLVAPVQGQTFNSKPSFINTLGSYDAGISRQSLGDMQMKNSRFGRRRV